MKKVLMAVLMVLAGVTLAYGGGKAIYRAHESTHWPTVEGTVTSSSVETLRGQRNVRFHPEVHYQYAVGGKPYTANTVSFGGNDAGALQDAQYVTHKYASGTKVPVHYAPEDPAVACLECGSAGVPSYVVALGGMMLAVMGALGVVDVVRASQRARRLMARQPAR